MTHDWRDSTFLKTRILFVLRLFLPFGQYTRTTDHRCQQLYILMCYNNVNFVLQKNCRISNKGPQQSSMQYFVVPEEISNIGYLRISGNKWHVKFALFYNFARIYPFVHNKVTSFTIITRYVLVKHGCPGSNKVKIWQTYLSPTFWHPGEHGMSVKYEGPIDELTVQVCLLYHQPLANFKYCTL